MPSVQALVPLESLILGDLSQLMAEKKHDPINYIMQPVKSGDDFSLMPYQRFLSLYRGVYFEGENLTRSCRGSLPPSYARPHDKDQVIRSIMATLQYIGLDTTSRALVEYSKSLEITTGEWQNLKKRLIGNYCSKNLSIISLKQLEKNLDFYFENETSIKLPSVDGNPFFANDLSKFFDLRKATEQEFLQTVKLFRAFCSWGGEFENPRLLAPLLKNPSIMAFVIRQMRGQELNWQSIDNSVFVQEKPGTGVFIWCDNLICRKREKLVFEKKAYRSIGSKSLEDDFKRIYCHELRDIDFNSKDQVPEVKKWIDGQSFDDFNLQTGQFISLISGVPNFLVRSNKFSDAKEFLRASMDESWDLWAKKQIQMRNKDLYYEEPLSLELVDRKLYFNEWQPNFKIMFDVNLGEFDRINQMVGKLKVKFDLVLTQKFMRWIRREWSQHDPRDVRKTKHLVKVFIQNIEDKVHEAQKNLVIPPWEGKLEDLIADELLQQLVAYKGGFFRQEERKNVTIPIYVNYSPFALKYLNFEYKIKKERAKLDYSTFEYSD